MTITINHCFGLGYRCNTDEFMKSLSIRKYSSPFSYMVTDLETSINFIKTDFLEFTNVVSIKEHRYKWNNHYWKHHLFFNIKYVPDDKYMNINLMKRVCCWNHHNLEDLSIIKSIKRRSNRLINAIKSNLNTLLIYIENIQLYTDNNWELYINLELIVDFIKDKPCCYILLLIPLLNFTEDPYLYKINEFINVIYYNSNTERDINDYGHKNIKWDIIQKITLNLYKFDIISLIEED